MKTLRMLLLAGIWYGTFYLFLGEFGDFNNAIYEIEDVKDYVFYPEQVCCIVKWNSLY